jgi:hypothetical protein
MQQQATTETKNQDKQITVTLKDDFYRDGFATIWLAIFLVLAIIIIIVMISIYFFIHQVVPVNFMVSNNFRVQQDEPLDKAYPNVTELLQWVSNVAPALLTTDVLHYHDNLTNNQKYFVGNGFDKYLANLKQFITPEEIIKNKYFINAMATGAPTILNQGKINNQYSWWIQMPLNINYQSLLEANMTMGMNTASMNTNIIAQLLIVRIPTFNNLEGIKIANIILKHN